MMRRGKIFAFAMVFVGIIAGLYMALSQNIEDYLLERERQAVIDQFRQSLETAQPDTPTHNEQTEATAPDAQPEQAEPEETVEPVLDKGNSKSPERWSALWERLTEYNQTIYSSGQKHLPDPWAYAESPVDLTDFGYESDVFGILSAPELGVELPIYLGASWQHMRDGAAQMTETSMPIGGINTNAVFAIHRSYIINVEEFEIGDTIFIENPWALLEYQVVSIQVIYPNEGDKVRIQPERDLITIVTCHPWGSGGLYRYLVIAERVKKSAAVSRPAAPQQAIQLIPVSFRDIVSKLSNQEPEGLEVSGGVEFVSSRREITLKYLMPFISLSAVGLGVILLLASGLKAAIKKIKNKRRER